MQDKVLSLYPLTLLPGEAYSPTEVSRNQGLNKCLLSLTTEWDGNHAPQSLYSAPAMRIVEPLATERLP